MIADQVPSQKATAAGGQTVFPFNFRCDDSATLQVYVNDVIQPGANYAVALNADQTASPGGTVTFGAGRAANDSVTVERDSTFGQSLHMTAYGPFPASTIELSLDKAVMILQELRVQMARVFKLARSAVGSVTNFDLPTPSLGALLGWVDSGGGVPKLGNISGVASGELLVDSGDHTHFTSVNAPIGTGALYRNGNRIFSPDDYSVAGNVWTVVIALGAGEKLNADYSH